MHEKRVARIEGQLTRITLTSSQAGQKERIMRLREVIQVTGQARATIYRKMAAKTFPLSFRLGEHSVGWYESEVQAWIGGLDRNRE